MHCRALHCPAPLISSPPSRLPHATFAADARPPQAAATLLVPARLRRAALRAGLRTFTDPFQSVRADAALLRAAPLMPRGVPIHGLVRAAGAAR